ncbi:MAG: hypothetical protein HFH36_03010 [Lachnospiraceae bacterium]|nr:hypothetical protein [Lachnospiraceae bacterium]
MSSCLKRRLAVFLCLFLSMPAILGAIPQAGLEVQAATTVNLNWQGVSSGSSTKGPEIQMTKKTKGFYMGDYLYAYSYGNSYKNYGTLSLNSGVKYKSKDTSVASVNASTGLVTPKKPGSTKITITYKNVSKECVIKVVSDLGKISDSYQPLKKASDTLIQAYGKKVTASNRYNLVNARNLYLEAKEHVTDYALNHNFGMQSTYDATTYQYKNKAHLPQLAHAYAISETVRKYVASANPIGTGSAKLFKVTGVRGSGSDVKANVSGKLTDSQIFGIKASVSRIWDSKIAKGNTAKFPLYVQDVHTKHRFYAIATATKGKNVLSIKVQNLKLKKKGSYRLVGISHNEIYRDWANQGKTSFQAK